MDLWVGNLFTLGMGRGAEEGLFLYEVNQKPLTLHTHSHHNYSMPTHVDYLFWVGINW